MKILGISHGKVRFNDLPKPQIIYPDDILVKIQYALLPPDDLELYLGGNMIIPNPYTFGQAGSWDHRRTRSRRLSQGAVGGGPGGLVLPRELRDVLPVQHRQAAVLPQHDLLHHLLRGIHDLEGGPISTKFRILCRWNRASFSRTSWIACAYSMKRRSTPIPRSQSSASITRAF